MRILIDCQSLQTGSRFRGIGRYAIGLIKGLTSQRPEDVFLLINGSLIETATEIRQQFKNLLSEKQFVYWYSSNGVDDKHGNSNAVLDSEILYEQAVIKFNPTVLVITSLFEGQSSNDPYFCPVERLHNKVPVACIIHDFIPYKNRAKHLVNEYLQDWYQKCFNRLHCVDAFLCNSNFTRNETELLFPGTLKVNISGAVDHKTFDAPSYSELEEIKALLEKSLKICSPYVLYTGGVEERKNLSLLIDAYSALPEALREKYKLVIVCGNHPEHISKVTKQLNDAGLTKNQFTVLGYVSDRELRNLYAASHLFVFPSKEEGLGFPVLEAMQCGTTVISSNATSLSEVHGLSEGQFNPHSVSELTKLLIKCLTDDQFYLNLKKHCNSQIQHFSWQTSAEICFSALEKIATIKKLPVDHKCYCEDEIIKRISFRKHSDSELKSVAVAIEKQFYQRVFYDISELSLHDGGTGIQRVTKGILENLHGVINNPNISVIPIAASPEGHEYHYVENENGSWVHRGKVEPCSNDLYVCVDLNNNFINRNIELFKDWKKRGVKFIIVVHDICFEFFPEFIATKEFINSLHQWLINSTTIADGLICVSRSVMNDVDLWIKQNHPSSQAKLGWFHLGSNLKQNHHVNHEETTNDKSYKSRVTFLAVSTIEPRKGYSDLLKGFHQAWANGVDANLIIVGRPGWMSEDVIDSITSSPEYNQRLFWYNNCSDEQLIEFYQNSDCFVFASHAEGFGLPLVEAAQYGLPLLVRDIPIFREIAQENAVYFSETMNMNLANRIEFCTKNIHSLPKSSAIKPLTWNQSTEQFWLAIKNIIK